MGKVTVSRRGGRKLGGAVGVAICTLLTGAIVLQGWYAPSISAAANPILHNSQNLGSTKWTQGWGIAGGKYGAFDCNTCHIPNSSNIKWVKPVITVLENFSSNGSSSVAVRFANVTSMGHDNRTPATSSANICEVCHTRTKYHNFNTTRSSLFPGGSLTHNNGTDCIGCHPHSTGFMPSSGSCTSCHGNPPNGTSTLVSSSPTNALGSSPVNGGAHDKHANVRGMACTTCHQGYSAQMGNNAIELGFQVDNTNWSQFSATASSRFGTYTGTNALAATYSWASPSGQAKIGTKAGVVNSCSVYCHGNWTGSNGTRPDWTGIGTVTCGKCHGTSAATPPTRGSHAKHAGNGTYTGYSISCSTCHPNRLSGDIAHITGNVQWQMSTGKAVVGSGATYKSAASGSTGALAPSASYGSCSTVYCHSNGRTTPNTAYNAPTWGGAAVAGCTRCHGNAKGSASVIGSNAHTAHVNNSSTKFNGVAIACAECHTQVVYANSTSLKSRTLHVNGAKNVDWGSVSNIGGSTAYSGGSCTKVYCHSNGQATPTYVAPPNWQTTADGTQGTKSCDMCHGGVYGNGTTTKDATVQISNKHGVHVQTDAGGAGFPHVAVSCDTCHRMTVDATGIALNTSATGLHLNGSRDARFKTFAYTNRSGTYDSGTKGCSNTYCHGNTATGSWANGNAKGCGACHSVSSDGNMSPPHARHIDSQTVTAASGWTSTNNSTTTAYVFRCGICHNTQTQHINGPQASGQGDAQVIFNLPFGAGTNSAAPGSSLALDGKGYYYSSATTCSVYCHSSGKATWTGRSVSWNAGSVVCGSCHTVSTNKTNTDWSAGHSKHMGSALGQYSSNSRFRCGTCHVSTVANGTNAPVVSYKAHVNGMRNVSSATWAGNGTKSLVYNKVAYTCSNTSCHSNGRTTPAQYAATANWQTLTPANTCLSCHGGRSNGTSTGVYQASASAFKLSTTHQRHLGKYSATQMSCQMCHAKTASDAATLKSYTGVRYHANGSKTVVLGAAYGTYTAYKTSGGDVKKCGNTTCHGGKSRTAWSENGALSSDNVCVKCHGVAGTSAADTNRNKYAPGYVSGATTGTDTDQVTSGIKVGAHFVHLSSVYRAKMKCNECHKVPSSAFDAGHMDQPRYGSATIVFDQASSAKWDAATSATLATFTGYTSGTQAKAATCSSVYCHGNRMKGADTSGTNRKVNWNQTSLTGNTPSQAVCSVCHGAPPTAGSTAGTHSGYTSINQCYNCHKHLTSTGAFIDKSLHMNGKVEVTLSCKNCHGSGSSKDVQTEFAKNSHHTNKTWANITDADCVVCHAEGSISAGVVAVDSSAGGRHGGTSGVKGVVDLYNGDNRATIYSVNLSYLTLASGTATDKLNANSTLDTFCMSCHDSNGAAAVTVGNGFTGSNAATNPFGDTTLTNGYDQQTRSFGAAPAPLNVYDQFNPANNSHHAVRQPRYTAGLSGGTNLGGLTGALTLRDAGLLSATVVLTNGTTGVDDKTQLHCNDCHSTAWSAHGSANEYMLQSATAANPTAESTGISDIVCSKCHPSAKYAGSGTHTGNSGDLVWTMGSTGAARSSSNGHITGIACLNCHDGNVGLGAIHGFPNATFTAGGSGGTYNKRRFMPGSSLYMYDPDTTDAGTDAGWTNATASNKCYTLGTAGSVGSCTKHSGGTSNNRRNVRRPVSY